MELHEAFINFFEENSMGLITEDWISGVQIALNTSLADNSAAKGTDQNAFNILCQKADKLSKDLSDIHKLEVQFRNYYTKCFVEYEDEGEDENEKQRKKLKRDQKKKLLSDEAARLIKVMGDIAVDLGIPRHVEIVSRWSGNRWSWKVTNRCGCAAIQGQVNGTTALLCEYKNPCLSTLFSESRAERLGQHRFTRCLSNT